VGGRGLVRGLPKNASAPILIISILLVVLSELGLY
jgi:hypothetical protein